jgi:hypothetical protein
MMANVKKQIPSARIKLRSDNRKLTRFKVNIELSIDSLHTINAQLDLDVKKTVSNWQSGSRGRTSAEQV